MSESIINQGEVGSVAGEDMNNSSIYLPKCDSNGVPLLKRIEKYPDLLESEFIPLVYEGIKDIYKINKLGEIMNSITGYLLKGTLNASGYRCCGLARDIVNNDGTLPPVRSYLVHRLVAFTFLENPDPNLYDVVNHLDQNRLNNTLSNLEYTTRADNGSVEKRKSRSFPENKLTNI